MGSDRERYREVIERAIAALDLPTKVHLLTGQDTWSLPPIPAIGLRSLVMSDGPIGVRGVQWTPDDPAVALPSPTALAATWEPDLARLAGRVLGQEARRKGVHVLLAPTVNLHRSPLGGRHFEAYSEDPLLTARIAVGYVRGVQEQGVGTTVKHYVANDFETQRFTANVLVSERALRELYLLPFEAVVLEAGGWGVMAAYNSVNGTTMTEHRELEHGLLKGEWDFDGAVVSDWTAARSVAAAPGGTDIAMPGPRGPWGAALVAAVRAGEVPESVVDDQVRRVLLLAARTGALEGVSPVVAQPPAPVDPDAVARELAARSFVLARNDGVLPVGGTETVALIGAAARDAREQGGGSAQVFPGHVVSPLEALTAALGDRLTYALGADPAATLPPAGGPQWTNLDGEPGVSVVLRAAGGAVLHTGKLPVATARYQGHLPGDAPLAEVSTVELVGRFTPEVTGRHELSVRGVGTYTLTVDGQSLYAGPLAPENDDLGVAFLAPPEHRVGVELTAGRPVRVVLGREMGNVEAFDTAVLHLGHRAPMAAPDELIEEAVAAAAAADVAVVVVATTEEVESEGFDRTHLALPGRQDELVARVAAANPRTVVVVNAGSPVLMPWADDVAAILLVWFPGQQGGAALADVLLGAAEPGGRLPTTWPGATEDCPVLSVTPKNGEVAYDEGVFIGYRAWERSGRAPLFPFGHGFGYTTWAYESVRVTGARQAVVRLRNSGGRRGREVVQLYIGPTAPDGDRPARWLAGFATVEAAPGETVAVTIPIPERALQVWAGGWRTVAGTYRAEASHSLTDPRVSCTFDAG